MLLDMVPYRSVGVTYDPANYAYSGEDPYQALLAIEDRVVYRLHALEGRCPTRNRG